MMKEMERKEDEEERERRESYDVVMKTSPG
jgi:hypothetical protein